MKDNIYDTCPGICTFIPNIPDIRVRGMRITDTTVSLCIIWRTSVLLSISSTINVYLFIYLSIYLSIYVCIYLHIIAEISFSYLHCILFIIYLSMYLVDTIGCFTDFHCHSQRIRIQSSFKHFTAHSQLFNHHFNMVQWFMHVCLCEYE